MAREVARPWPHRSAVPGDPADVVDVEMSEHTDIDVIRLDT
jgi:hypothetical protein